jgi:hypothetical protein
MKTWKTSEIVRLSQIEKWAKARLERRTHDTTAAMRAAIFYTAIACRANALAYVERMSEE